MNYNVDIIIRLNMGEKTNKKVKSKKKKKYITGYKELVDIAMWKLNGIRNNFGKKGSWMCHD